MLLEDKLHKQRLDKPGLKGHCILASVNGNRLRKGKVYLNVFSLNYSDLKWLLYHSLDIPAIDLAVVKKLDTFLRNSIVNIAA